MHTQPCLCKLGQVLYQNWIEELENHALAEYVYFAMKTYFTHKATCPGCCSPTVLEHNHLYYPELWKSSNPS